MNDDDPYTKRPTPKQARDARRQAHETEKKQASSGKGGGMKGMKGKGKRTP